MNTSQVRWKMVLYVSKSRKARQLSGTNTNSAPLDACLRPAWRLAVASPSKCSRWQPQQLPDDDMIFKELPQRLGLTYSTCLSISNSSAFGRLVNSSAKHLLAKAQGPTRWAHLKRSTWAHSHLRGILSYEFWKPSSTIQESSNVLKTLSECLLVPWKQHGKMKVVALKCGCQNLSSCCAPRNQRHLQDLAPLKAKNLRASRMEYKRSQL